jgi:hypothetical protein
MTLSMRLCAAVGLFLALDLSGAPAEAAGTKVNGEIGLELALKVNPAIPDGTPVSISATVAASDSVYSNSSLLYLSGTVRGGIFKTTTTIYYAWTVASKHDNLSINLSISGGKGSYSATASLYKTIPLPANGAVTKVIFDDAL